MAMPANTLSPLPTYSAFLAPDDRVRASLLVDYEMGGADIGDPSQGLQVKAWEARVDGSDIQVRPDGAGAWTTVTSDSGVTEIALAFDQNMRPTIAYVAGGVAKLYWYDATAAAYVTTSFPGAESPVVTMDDKRDMQVGLNDVLLFYLQDGRVKHRRQRDRYTIEYDLEDVPTGMTRIARWGFTEGKRVQLEFSTGVASVASGEGQLGTFYTDLRTDTLYAVDGTDIIPFIDSTEPPRTAVWRSKKFIIPGSPVTAWGRVNGPLTDDVTVRLYGDGALISTDTVATRTPFRIPAKRARAWEIEVESTSQVSSVVIATSSEELTG
ncbi:MAG: hypothetical protein E6Q97_09080 [Desulfurellales bacterium]|nr:MAG: hypothetical protein E6Q97_09080 [Desulfurellales bacterium]